MLDIRELSRMLRGKVALVTGSTQGIGFQILETLAGAGSDIVMHGLGDEYKLSKLQNYVRVKYKVEVMMSDIDLRCPPKIHEMIHEIHSHFGRLDILINNAGIQHVSPIQDFPEKQWDDILAVILTSSFHTIKHALPKMLENNWGRIINTGSMHSLVASPYKSAYNAAKHGLAGLTKTVALETAGTGITCNSICPGYVLTDLVKNQLEDTARSRGISKDRVISEVMLADQPTKSFVRAEEVAALALHLCGPYSSSITGSCISIDGGWTAK